MPENAAGVKIAPMQERAPVVVPWREFDPTEPWNMPEGCPPLVLTRSGDGSAPRLATLLHVYRDRDSLYLLFSGVDREVVATHYDRDAPLWQEDVLEAFLAPERLERYFEFEVSPIGTIFDAAIDSPDLERRTMSADVSWDSPATWAAIRRVGRPTGPLWRFETLVVLPFADLGGSPEAGATWRANFFRIDRDSEMGDEFTAWQPTGRTPPDFHVPPAFGTLIFAGP